MTNALNVQRRNLMNKLKLDKKDWLYKSNLVESCSEKIECLKHAIIEDHDDAIVWHDLGDIYADFDHDKAVYCWNYAVKFYEKRIEQFKYDAREFQKNSNHLLFMNIDTAEVQDEISMRLYNLGSCYTNLEKYSFASESFLKSYSIDSENVDAIYYASRALYDSERMSEALKHLLEYVEIINDYRAYYLIGMIYWGRNEIMDALKNFWRCINTANNNIDSCYHKHLAFNMLGNKDLAGTFLKDAVMQDLDDVDMIENLIEYYEENDQPKRAYRYYRILHQKEKKRKKLITKTEDNHRGNEK